MKVISDTLRYPDDLHLTLQRMYNDVKIDEIENKYGTITNDELLNEYKKD